MTTQAQLEKAASVILHAIDDAQATASKVVSTELTVLDKMAAQSLSLKLYDDIDSAKAVTVLIYGDGKEPAQKTARSECLRIFKASPSWKEMTGTMDKLIAKNKPAKFRKVNFLKQLATKVNKGEDVKDAAEALFERLTTDQPAPVHAPTKKQVDKWIKQVNKISVAKNGGTMTKAERDVFVKSLRELKGYL